MGVPRMDASRIDVSGMGVSSMGLLNIVEQRMGLLKEVVQETDLPRMSVPEMGVSKDRCAKNRRVMYISARDKCVRDESSRVG